MQILFYRCFRERKTVQQIFQVVHQPAERIFMQSKVDFLLYDFTSYSAHPLFCLRNAAVAADFN